MNRKKYNNISATLSVAKVLAKEGGVVNNTIVKVVDFIIIAVIFTFLGTIIFKNEHYYKDKFQNDLLNYMNKKYDTEFEIYSDSFWQEHFLNFSYSAKLKRVNHDSGFIEERIYDNGIIKAKATIEPTILYNTDKIYFQDNYIIAKTEREADEKMEKLASDVFGEHLLYGWEPDFDSQFQPDDFNVATTFEECVSKCNLIFYYNVILPSDKSAISDEQLENFRQQCAEKLLSCKCDIYFNDSIYNSTKWVSDYEPDYSFCETLDK